MPTEINIQLFAINPIKINGKKFFNETFTCSDEDQARELVELGSAEYVNTSNENTAADTGSNADVEDNTNSIPAERIEIVKAAILQLDPSTKAHWDKDGSPAVKALSKVSGSVIQKEERDFVWALVNG